MKSPVFDFQRIPACLLALATFFVAIKPAPCNLFLFLAVVSVFVSPQHRASLRQHTLSAPGLAAIGFFLLMCATQLYSHSAWAQAQEYVWKYMRIAYLPFLAAALLDERDQTLVLKAFVAAMLLTLFLSFGNALVPGFCAALNLTNCGPPSNPFVFKQHITHGFFMALAAGLLGFWAYQQRNLVWAVLAALATFNVLYMLEGRTGWLVVLTFLVISATVYMGWKKALLLSAITLLPCLWYLFVSTIPVYLSMCVCTYI